LLESAPQLAAASRANLAAALIAGGRRPDAVELLNTAPLDRTVTDSPETDGCLNTATRDAAALLCAWLDADPRHPSVPERVAQLEAHARDGRWNTTQDNAMALLALGKYCRIRPAFPAQSTGTVAWVEAGDAHAWTANARTVTLDRAWQFQPRDCRAVAITNHGPGPLYFHWRSEGVPADGQVEEADRGMEVRRTLLDADGRPLDAERVEQGQLVVVDISIRAPGTVLRNVVVDDLLPAGLEVENARLDTAQVIPWARNVPALAVRHVDVRDDRVLLFVREVEGRRSFRYAARAVTPGEYVCPPVQAECMYDPNVRSVHGRHRLLVVAMEPDPVPKAP
jgi:uncharacterized protein YfaS (alpha-2-macroglobulin family)